VSPLTAAELAQIQVHQQDEPMTAFAIAPDRFLKHKISGGGPYWLSVPSRSMDGIIQGDVLHRVPRPPTLVHYLRVCFRFAGFPGMAALPTPPEADLQYVPEGFQLF
jgi:hypothetical protein